MITSALMLGACSTGGNTDAKIIDKPDFTSPDGQYTIAALEALGRVSAPSVSPDGKKLLYGVSYESVEENKSNLDLYVTDIDGTDTQRITRTADSENGAVWMANGEKIAFISPVDGKPQLWVMNADGSGRKAVSNVEGGIQGFLLSPDESKVVMIGTVKYGRTPEDVYPLSLIHI